MVLDLEKKKTVVSLLMLSLLLLTCIPSVFGTSKDWVEVLRFTGTGLATDTTEVFAINHVDWRIHWSFESNIDPPPTVFMITVYDLSGNIFDFFVTAFEGNGTLDYNKTGSFYLSIRRNYVKEYEVIVEQNINSIPEFPPTIIVPFLIGGTSIFMIIRKKSFKKGIYGE